MKNIFILSIAFVFVFAACNEEEKFSSISGVLKTEAGEVLALSTVFLKQNETTLQQVITDDNGLFVFENLKPGVYTLKAFNEKFKYSKDIEYTVDEGVNYDLEMIFSPYISLSGSVFIDGYPYPSTSIELYNTDKVGLVDDTRLDAESSFEFYNIDKGNYLIHLKVTKEHFVILNLFEWSSGWTNFSFTQFISQDVFYLINIKENEERNVVLNITWDSSAGKFVINK
jgi:hypothetical protein